MVKILANGDIVPDNDPRVNSNQPKPRRQGQIQHNEDEEDEQAGRYGEGHGHAHDGNQASVFDSLNQRLIDAGLPRWNLGEHVIEPIVSVGFLLAFLLMGFRGILFGAMLFAVNKLSQRPGGLSGLFQSFTGGGGGNNARRTSQRGGVRRGTGPPPSSQARSTGSGGGNRLGRK